MRNSLLRAQRFDRVALCGAAGGDQAAQHGKQSGQNDQDQRGLRRQRGYHVHIARDVVDEHIAGDEQQQAEHHAHHAGTQADDKGLGVEHLRDVVLGGTDGAQNADLLAALQHADIGDDADHDGGHHQRDRHKGHQHIADHAHDLGDRVHQGAHHVSVVNHLVVLALLPHGGVVGVQLAYHLRFGVKAVGIDIDAIGFCVVHIADVAQNLFVAGSGGEQGVFDHLSQVGAGHVDLDGLLDVLQSAKKIDGPVMVHVLTKKGKGYKPAEESPNKFHGTGPFDIATGKKITNPNAPVSYTEVFGKTLSKLADTDDKIVGITAAMPDGTGLNIFAEAHKDHFFDVGIAEQHAVTAAAGMAAAGMKPVAAIYSTFMQRAYDSIMHDICMQKLHVTLCLDRAGLVGDDGYTHHGVFDYAYLRSIPNMTIMAPKDENELQHMLKTALDFDGPVSVRYPRGSGVGVALDTQWQDLSIGKAEVLRTGKDVCFWAIGSMVQTALDAAELLEAQGISAGVVNMRFAKPLDVELLREHAQSYGKIITLEEGVLAGGVGSAVLEELNANKLLEQCEVRCFGIPDEFVMHGDKKLLFRDLGLDTPTIAAKAAAFVKGEEE